MSATSTVAKREIKTYFNSPVAYIVVTVFMLLAGYLFWSQLFLEKQAELRYYFTLTPLLFTFIIPAITMRLIAEEKGSGTLEMLITMPVRDWEFVLGKFLAGMAMLGGIVGMTMFYAVTLTLLSPVDKGPLITGYLGLLLMGGAYVSIGVMASWSPFAGASEIAGRQAAQGRADAARAMAEAAEAGAAVERSATRTQLEVALARLGIAEVSVAQGTEAHRIVAKKYAGGLATVAELLGAAALETQTRLGLADARYQAIVADAAARQAAGADLMALTVLEN